METKKTLIRAALKRVDWKTEYGIAVQLGIENAVEDINAIASWLVENRDQETMLIDDGRKQGGSFLDGLKPQVGEHFTVPPSMNGRVQMYIKPPKFKFPIHFLSVPTGELYGLEAVAEKIKPGTILYGTASSCADVLEAAELTAQPLLHCGQLIVVRAA